MGVARRARNGAFRRISYSTTSGARQRSGGGNLAVLLVQSNLGAHKSHFATETVGTKFNSAAELEKDGTVQLSLNSKVVDP
jgi:hypothetical protein